MSRPTPSNPSCRHARANKFVPCSAATVQLSTDKAANAVGGAVADRLLNRHRLGSRMRGLQHCVEKYMSEHSIDEQASDPCFFGIFQPETISGVMHKHRIFSDVMQRVIPSAAVVFKSAVYGHQCNRALQKGCISVPQNR